MADGCAAWARAGSTNGGSYALSRSRRPRIVRRDLHRGRGGTFHAGGDRLRRVPGRPARRCASPPIRAAGAGWGAERAARLPCPARCLAARAVPGARPRRDAQLLGRQRPHDGAGATSHVLEEPFPGGWRVAHRLLRRRAAESRCPPRGRTVSLRGGRWVAQGGLAAAAALGVTAVGGGDPVTTALLIGASCGVLVASGVGLVLFGAADEERGWGGADR